MEMEIMGLCLCWHFAKHTTKFPAQKPGNTSISFYRGDKMLTGLKCPRSHT